MLQKRLNVMGRSNDNDFTYITQKTLQERQQKYQIFLTKLGQGKALVVVEQHKFANLYPQNNQTPWKIFAIDKSKTLVEFLMNIKHNAQIDLKKSIFLYCNNQILMLTGHQTVGQLYEKQKNQEDGHLYIKYADFETFG